MLNETGMILITLSTDQTEQLVAITRHNNNRHPTQTMAASRSFETRGLGIGFHRNYCWGRVGRVGMDSVPRLPSVRPSPSQPVLGSSRNDPPYIRNFHIFHNAPCLLPKILHKHCLQLGNKGYAEFLAANKVNSEYTKTEYACSAD